MTKKHDVVDTKVDNTITEDEKNFHVLEDGTEVMSVDASGTQVHVPTGDEIADAQAREDRLDDAVPVEEYAAEERPVVKNAQRDAEALFFGNLTSKRADVTLPALRRDSSATGPRDAQDLAYVLEARPAWVNELDHLDDLERAENRDPAPWVRNPEDLLDEAKLYMFTFVGTDGNFIR